MFPDNIVSAAVYHFERAASADPKTDQDQPQLLSQQMAPNHITTMSNYFPNANFRILMANRPMPCLVPNIYQILRCFRNCNITNVLSIKYNSIGVKTGDEFLYIQPVENLPNVTQEKSHDIF